MSCPLVTRFMNISFRQASTTLSSQNQVYGRPRRLPEGPKCRQSLERTKVLDEKRDPSHALAHAPLKLLPTSTTEIARDEETIMEDLFGVLDGFQRPGRGKWQSYRSVRIVGRSPDGPMVDQKPRLCHPDRYDRNPSWDPSHLACGSNLLHTNLSSLRLSVSMYEE